MLFALSQRNSGTVALVVTGNEQQRNQLQAFLKDHLHEYRFYDLDLTPYQHTSLHTALTELLPAQIKQETATNWLINITGLENALYKTIDGKITFSSLVAQLNFERELLFKQPHLLVLWISRSFYDTLRRQAPDLMHWLSNRFIFADDNATPEMAEAAVAQGSIRKRGNIPQRTSRIAELKALYEKLAFDHNDTERLVKDKINLLILLGKEYCTAFDFEHSEEALKKALHISERIKSVNTGEIAFELATTYLHCHKLDEALDYYNRCLSIDLKRGYEKSFGAIYHQIGRVFEEKRNFLQAMENYQKAIKWKAKTGDENKLVGTYHQIGRLYEEQRKWAEALENYQKAIEWSNKMGNDHELGVIYHQIGTVYAEQRNWLQALENYLLVIELAKKTDNDYDLGSTYHQIGVMYAKQGNLSKSLNNYQKAIELNTKNGNEYALGNTYHQIGRAYEEQGNWLNSLENYQQAIKWKIKTGNENKLGSTYHQIGRLYEAQHNLKEARKYFFEALKNQEKFSDSYFPSTKASLARVEAQLKLSPTKKLNHFRKGNKKSRH